MTEKFLLSFLPLCYLVAMLWSAARGGWRDAGFSLIIVGATVAGGLWAMSWPGSSAGWATLFLLPSVAGAAGLLALAYGGSRNAGSKAVRHLGRVALVATVPLSIAEPCITWRDDQRIAALQADAWAQWRATQANRRHITTMPRDSVEEMIRQPRVERNFVLTALDRRDLSPELLDALATDDVDTDLLAKVIRHPDTGARTLTRVYRSSAHRQLVSSLLAAQPNTPPAILRELHAVPPAAIPRLDESLAGNRSVPRDILDEIARTTTSVSAATNLLGNPVLDCELARHVAASPAASSGWGSDGVRARAARLESTLCH